MWTKRPHAHTLFRSTPKKVLRNLLSILCRLCNFYGLFVNRSMLTVTSFHGSFSISWISVSTHFNWATKKVGRNVTIEIEHKTPNMIYTHVHTVRVSVLFSFLFFLFLFLLPDRSTTTNRLYRFKPQQQPNWSSLAKKSRWLPSLWWWRFCSFNVISSLIYPPSIHPSNRPHAYVWQWQSVHLAACLAGSDLAVAVALCMSLNIFLLLLFLFLPKRSAETKIIIILT